MSSQEGGPSSPADPTASQYNPESPGGGPETTPDTRSAFYPRAPEPDPDFVREVISRRNKAYEQDKMTLGPTDKTSDVYSLERQVELINRLRGPGNHVSDEEKRAMGERLELLSRGQWYDDVLQEARQKGNDYVGLEHFRKMIHERDQISMETLLEIAKYIPSEAGQTTKTQGGNDNDDALQNEIVRLGQQVAAQAKVIEDMNSTGKTKRIVELREEIKEKDDRLRERDAEIKKKDEMLKQQNNKLEMQKKKITDLVEDNKDAEKELQELNEKLEPCENIMKNHQKHMEQMQEKDRIINSKEKEIEALRFFIEQQNEKFDKQEDRLDDQDEMIKDLKKKLSDALKRVRDQANQPPSAEKSPPEPSPQGSGTEELSARLEASEKLSEERQKKINTLLLQNKTMIRKLREAEKDTTSLPGAEKDAKLEDLEAKLSEATEALQRAQAQAAQPPSADISSKIDAQGKDIENLKAQLEECQNLRAAQFAECQSLKAQLDECQNLGAAQFAECQSLKAQLDECQNLGAAQFAECQSLKAQLDECQNLGAAQFAECQSLKAQLDECQNLRAAQFAECQSLKAQLDECQSLKAQLDEYQSLRAHLEEESQNLKVQLKECQELSEERNKKVKEADAQGKEIEHLKAQLEDLEAQLEKCQKLGEERQKKVEEADAQGRVIENLRAKVADLEAQVADLEAQLEGCAELSDERQKKINSLLQQNNAMSRKINEAGKKTTDTSGDESTRNGDAKDAKIESLEGALRSCQDTAGRLKAENEELEAALQKTKQEIKHAEKTRQAFISAETKPLQDTVDYLRRKLNDVEGKGPEKPAMEGSLDLDRSKAKRLQERVGQLEHELEEKEGSLVFENSENKRLQDRVDQLERKLQESNAHVEKLQEEGEEKASNRSSGGGGLPHKQSQSPEGGRDQGAFDYWEDPVEETSQTSGSQDTKQEASSGPVGSPNSKPTTTTEHAETHGTKENEPDTSEDISELRETLLRVQRINQNYLDRIRVLERGLERQEEDIRGQSQQFHQQRREAERLLREEMVRMLREEVVEARRAKEDSDKRVAALRAQVIQQADQYLKLNEAFNREDTARTKWEANAKKVFSDLDAWYWEQLKEAPEERKAELKPIKEIIDNADPSMAVLRRRAAELGPDSLEAQTIRINDLPPEERLKARYLLACRRLGYPPKNHPFPEEERRKIKKEEEIALAQAKPRTGQETAPGNSRPSPPGLSFPPALAPHAASVSQEDRAPRPGVVPSTERDGTYETQDLGPGYLRSQDNAQPSRSIPAGPPQAWLSVPAPAARPESSVPTGASQNVGDAQLQSTSFAVAPAPEPANPTVTDNPTGVTPRPVRWSTRGGSALRIFLLFVSLVVVFVVGFDAMSTSQVLRTGYGYYYHSGFTGVQHVICFSSWSEFLLFFVAFFFPVFEFFLQLMQR